MNPSDHKVLQGWRFTTRAGDIISCLYRNTLLVCWQEVLTGSLCSMADLQYLQEEVAKLHLRVPDGACLESMWGVVARSLKHHVAEVMGVV